MGHQNGVADMKYGDATFKAGVAQLAKDRRSEAGYRLRKRLQPLIEQDMQVIAELERKMMRLLNAANLRAMRKL